MVATVVILFLCSNFHANLLDDSILQLTWATHSISAKEECIYDDDEEEDDVWAEFEVMGSQTLSFGYNYL